MRVLNFTYNGFAGTLTRGYARYTAEFLSWTEDPGIALCKCSDGKKRLIPTFALEDFDYKANPEPEYDKPRMVWGIPCRS